MNLRRGIRPVLVVILAMNGSLLGSEPDKHLQVRKSDLGTLIRGQKVALHLVQGARVEGRVREVTNDALVIKVKKSSQPLANPKGQMEIPQAAVSRIEVLGFKGNNRKRVLATVGTFAGALFGALSVVMVTGSDSGGTVAEGVVAVAIPIGAATLVYRALAPKDITIIEILPDFPGKRGPTSANKHQEATLAVSRGTSDLSFVETSGPEQFRLQARRAVMRQDIPLDLSSLPGHAAQ